jgi:DNA-binding NtrC family response regulator
MTRPRLLLVEPDDAVRRVLSRVLARDFEVTPIATSTSALGRLVEQSFDRLLLDAAAGEIDAFRAACARHTAMRVVVMSAAPALAIEGATNLVKPFHTDALRRALA